MLHEVTYSGFVNSQYIIILSCILVARYKHVFYAVTSTPAEQSVCDFLNGASVFAQQTNIVSVDQELMCSIQFHPS
jgi:hypothetical protein